MQSGPRFFLAARQCEIADLEQLALTSELVGVIARLIHALQKERGISNVFLASRGARFGDQRLQQVQACQQVERAVRAHFDALDTASGAVRNGSRLFSRVAVVLHALDALPTLRQRIAVHALPLAESTASFVRLIAGLLVVVFEAADSASDPVISRALVALFNFMQGKEFAGQERALGSAVFAAADPDANPAAPWQQLIDSQERCFELFCGFADAAPMQAWRACQPAAHLSELERLRRIGFARVPRPHDPSLVQTWYDCCTERIDAMKSVEDMLTGQLRQLCERRIAQARSELRDQQALLDALALQAITSGVRTPEHYGPQLDRSILGMVQEQSQRLQAMADELETARAALQERKVVERAKGLLMASRKLSEDEAYKMLRQTAMSQNRKLLDVAQSVLAMADFL